MTVLDRPVERAPISKARDWRFLGRSADFWICATLTLIVVLVQGWNIAGYPTVFDDEGTYLAQAWAIDHGVGMAPYTYWFAALLILILGPGLFAVDTLLKRWAGTHSEPAHMDA